MLECLSCRCRKGGTDGVQELEAATLFSVFAVVGNRDGDYRDLRSRMSGQGQTKFRVQLVRSVLDRRLTGVRLRVQIGEAAVRPGKARGRVRSPSRRFLELGDGGFHRGEDCADLLAGALDGGDTEDRDETGEQRVFDQVLTLLVA